MMSFSQSEYNTAKPKILGYFKYKHHKRFIHSMTGEEDFGHLG